MRHVTVFIVSVVSIAASVVICGQRAGSGAVAYEGARLIVGDAMPTISSGTFVVQGGRITAIGPSERVEVPAGSTRVNLSGKTVMPTLNNVHIHAGYEAFSSWGAENHSAANLLDHLEREAFYGVGAAMTMGDQPDDFAIKFQRDQIAGKFPTAARFFFAAGITLPEAGPDLLLITGTTPLHATHEVSTANEAVAAVRAIAAKKITQIKIWVDERDATRGTHKKMSPEIYSAIIQEAHKHGIIVHAHVTRLEDQKAVVQAGVDVIVHTVQNRKIDDEFVALLKAKKPYWAPVMGLGDTNELCEDNNPFVTQALADSVVSDARAGKTPIGKYYPTLSTPCPSPGNPTAEENRKANFSQMIAAGARLLLSTDAGVSPKYAYGSAEHHEIEMYVRYGLPPAEAIVAATSRPTEVLKISETGTLTKGKRADFVVLNANPLENIRNTRAIDSVYLAGIKVDRGELQSKFKKGLIDRDAYQAKTKHDYVAHGSKTD
jgi:imidazolonepropionase-like amidohydrolase